jgi:hypothetical protein
MWLTEWHWTGFSLSMVFACQHHSPNDAAYPTSPSYACQKDKREKPGTFRSNVFLDIGRQWAEGLAHSDFEPLNVDKITELMANGNGC